MELLRFKVRAWQRASNRNSAAGSGTAVPIGVTPCAGRCKLYSAVKMFYKQNLAVGMRLWGAVLEASPRGLTVALPHGLRGRVSPAEVPRGTK